MPKPEKTRLPVRIIRNQRQHKEHALQITRKDQIIGQSVTEYIQAELSKLRAVPTDFSSSTQQPPESINRQDLLS